VTGVIQAITEIGVEVNTHSDVETLTLRQSPNVNLGEGYLVWRCSECGELGDINQIPDRCRNCGADKETLYAYLED
jgi:rubrerythrin